MELRRLGKVLTFLAVVGIFAWPGYEALTSVMLPVTPAAAPIAQPLRPPADETRVTDRPTPTAPPTRNPPAPMLTPTPIPTSARMPTLASEPAPTPVSAPNSPTPTHPATRTATLASTHTPTRAPTQVPVPRTTPIPSPTPVPAATQPPTPHLRYMDEKGYMLRLINNERRAAGVPEVVLGVNDAAQLHAEDSLEGCYSSHWGSDGLKPYMRYSLAGGYQSNGENGSGIATTASRRGTGMRRYRVSKPRLGRPWQAGWAALGIAATYWRRTTGR